MYQSVSSIERLFFSSNFFIYQFDISVFWPVWALNLILPFILLFLSFCFCAFLDVWMLYNVNKAKYNVNKAKYNVNKATFTAKNIDSVLVKSQP